MDGGSEREPAVREEPVPDGTTVEALGLLSEALESAHRARGALYAFHQLTGKADETLGRAADLLREAGHGPEADRLAAEMVGRDVLPGRWTYQVVEEYDDTYWEPFVGLEREVRGALAGGRRHLHEARMREERRTHAHRD